jgi:16S rRNA (guanine(966)-N(2))-methyltransferase RsmD
VFVDAYAGTGAVGIEALSRGARKAIFIERSRAAVEVIRDNLASLGLAGRSEVFASKTLPVLERVEADMVFLDPPYEMEKEYKDALELLGTREDTGLVIAQHSVKVELAKTYGNLHKSRVVKQGDNSLSFFTKSDAG